jgi:glycosyltransferase involved in cell wall biosynthesis
MRKNKVLIAAHTGQPWGGISSNYQNLLASSLREQVDLFFVETSSQRTAHRAGNFGAHNFLPALAMIGRFWRALVKNNPDIIHIGTAHLGSFLKHSVMILIGRLMGKKVIVMLHCGYKVLLPESGVWRRFVLFILSCCHAIAVISKEWLALQTLLPYTSINYIPNALNLAPYLSLSSARFEGRQDVKVLYLGHIGRDKGIFDLIEAAKKVCQSVHVAFRIDLLGESLSAGEYEKAQNQIAEYGLGQVVYLWKPEFDEKKLWRLAEADIYVLPSYSEGMPISIIEALASALPVVATQVGGIPDMIESGYNGLLISPQNPNQLADALIQLINNSSLRRQMGELARKVACERFSMEERVKKLVNLYSEILTSR